MVELRDSGEALVHYGKKDEKKSGKEDEDLFLIGLYLYSTDVNDFNQLLSNQSAHAAFMAAIFLDKENADMFESLAEERYESLS
jgi:hypothetical protein